MSPDWLASSCYVKLVTKYLAPKTSLQLVANLSVNTRQLLSEQIENVPFQIKSCDYSFNFEGEHFRFVIRVTLFTTAW